MSKSRAAAKCLDLAKNHKSSSFLYRENNVIGIKDHISPLKPVKRSISSPYYCYKSGHLIQSIFQSSSCLITISRDRTIVGKSENPKQKFSNLMGKLRILDRNRSKSMIWVVDAGRHYSNGTSDGVLENFAILQNTVNGIQDRDLREWLQARSIFIVSNFFEGWAIEAVGISASEGEDSPLGYPKASDFFRSLSWKTWSKYEAVTAFVDGKIFNRSHANSLNSSIRYYGHWHDDSRGIIGKWQRSNSDMRNYFIGSFYEASVANINNNHDNEVFSNLYKSGFAVFDLEKFVMLR